MRILVTGGSGMVGKNLIQIIPKNKHNILAPSKNELDLRDYKKVINYLLLAK